jgi:hypothetical protein
VFTYLFLIYKRKVITKYMYCYKSVIVINILYCHCTKDSFDLGESENDPQRWSFDVSHIRPFIVSITSHKKAIICVYVVGWALQMEIVYYASVVANAVGHCPLVCSKAIMLPLAIRKSLRLASALTLIAFLHECCCSRVGYGELHVLFQVCVRWPLVTGDVGRGRCANCRKLLCRPIGGALKQF